MKTNEELQRDVQNAMKWEPVLHAAAIGVTVNDGIVTLTGTVDAYFKKTEAENAAKNVAGVTALVENIIVRLPSKFIKSDNEVAEEVLKALKDSWSVPADKIKVKVEHGRVTLDGKLPWNYQREAAKNNILFLPGVTGVTNNIMIESEVKEAIEVQAVEAALERNWAINCKKITVTASGTTVTLTGTVDSMYQKDEACRIAWNTPGVWSVINKLVVEYDYSYVEL